MPVLGGFDSHSLPPQRRLLAAACAWSPFRETVVPRGPRPRNKTALIGVLATIDPETEAPATKNPFLDPKPGVLLMDEMALDRLLAKGAVVGACNIALQVRSKMLAGNAGVSAEEAATEWAANVVSGITLIPSGTWGVNRAQESGCTYCAGG